MREVRVGMAHAGRNAHFAGDERSPAGKSGVRGRSRSAIKRIRDESISTRLRRR